jgi:hypothetical protein
LYCHKMRTSGFHTNIDIRPLPDTSIIQPTVRFSHLLTAGCVEIVVQLAAEFSSSWSQCYPESQLEYVRSVAVPRNQTSFLILKPCS